MCLDGAGRSRVAVEPDGKATCCKRTSRPLQHQNASPQTLVGIELEQGTELQVLGSNHRANVASQELRNEQHGAAPSPKHPRCHCEQARQQLSGAVAPRALAELVGHVRKQRVVGRGVRLAAGIQRVPALEGGGRQPQSCEVAPGVDALHATAAVPAVAGAAP
eukprot:CAMPEP_0175748366 /NCGR_PEP_ID=MMETSP0097-20121207/59584_1 /TAXON_ID=311494 /ORGANISM="Alexandrium monilatum, Strain CCMP3105" /LENGTH=162 /DNA_ID=CAMNT_0017056861 /DNA_START=14 /DNA_END=498 /DNA_ORIENTATION=+